MWLLLCGPIVATAASEDDAWLRAERAQAFGFGEGLAVGTLMSGKPRLIRTEPNRHDSAATDRLETVSLPGLQLELRRLPHRPEWPFFERLVVTRNGFLLSQGLRIGVSTPGDVEKVLGKPDRRAGSDFVYVGLSEICEDRLQLGFGKGKLVTAEWEWCSD
jgi:hypothetical protein